MDNASGNVPNVPLEAGGEELVENSEQDPGQGFGEMLDSTPVSQPVLNPTPTGEDEPAPIGGMMETLLSPDAAPTGLQQVGDAEQSASSDPNTLDNDAILYAPTPIDIDPPPLQDVTPLSMPAPEPIQVSAEPAEFRKVSGSLLNKPAVPEPEAAPVVEPEPVPVPVEPAPVPEVPELAVEPVPDPPQMPEPVEAFPEPLPELEPEPLPMTDFDAEQTKKVMLPPTADEVPVAVPEVEPEPEPIALEPLSEEVALPLPSEPVAEPEPEPGPDPGRGDLLDSLLGLEQPEPVEEVAAETIQDAPLLEMPTEELPVEELAVEGDESVEEVPIESLPSLLLTPEEAPQVEDSAGVEETVEATEETELPEVRTVAEPEPETESAGEDVEEKPKQVFQQETLSTISQKVETTDGPKKEGYVKNEFFVSEGAEDPWILPATATAGVAANLKKRRTFGKLNVGVWSTFTTIFFVGSILLLGGLAIAWGMRGTIGKKIEANIVSKVEDAGYYAAYDGWKYDAVRGLILEGVTVYENADKVVPYAKVSNIGLNTDIFALLQKKDPQILKKTVSFRDSDLILFDRGAEVANFKQLTGALELDKNKIGLEDLEGQIEGAMFEVEGDVVMPTDTKAVALWDSDYIASSETTSDNRSRRYEVAKQTAMELAQSSGPIIIRDPGTLAREVKEGAGRILKDVEDSLPGDEPDSGAPEEEYKPMFAPRTDIVIPKSVLEKPVPKAEPAPAPEPVPAPVVEPAPIPEPIVVEEPVPAPPVVETPVVEAPAIPATALDTSSVAPDTIDVPSTDMVSSSEPGTPMVSDYNGQLSQLPSLAFLSDFTKYLKIKSNGSPPQVTSKIDVDLSNSENPKIKASGRLTGKSITMQDTLMEGITFTDVDAPFSYDHESGQLNLPGFTLGHGGEGTLAGKAAYNMAAKMLNLNEVRSSIDLIGLITEFDPDMKTVLRNMRFLDSPEIHITRGQIPIESPLSGQLDFGYEQWAGMIINSAGKSLPIKKIRGDFKLNNGILAVPRLSAVVLDGLLDTTGSLGLNDSNYPYNGTIKVRSLPMESLAKYTGIDSQYMKGLLNLDYQGIVAKEIARMGGNGRVDLQNSQLYKVPVIGPVQRLLGAAIPVFGSQGASAVAGNFIIESGVLMSSDLTVRSDGTKVGFKLQADLTHQLTAFKATANLDGPLGIATGLINEQIQVDGSGPLHHPRISLAGGALPSKFLNDQVRGMLGISDGSAEALSAMMQEIAGGGGGVSSLIKGVGRMRRQSAPPATTVPEVPKAVGTASNILNGIKSGDSSAVGRGIQNVLNR